MKRIFFHIILALGCFANLSAQLNLQWQSLGPDNLGGEVRGLIIDKRDSTRQTLYAGTMGGGVWKTTNGGNNWNYLGCMGNYAVSCMSQASNGTIYIGTGYDASGLASNMSNRHLGNGIYKLDSADNFVHFDSTTSTSNLPGYSNCWSAVNRIAINPLNPAQLIAANTCGLYKSVDGGNTWSEISIAGISPDYGALDVKWSTDGSKIFAEIGGPFGGAQIVRSLDGGNTWTKMNGSPGYPAQEFGRIEIAIAPSNPNIIYLEIAETGGCFYGVLKTSDGGDSWDTVAMSSTSFNPLGSGECQGWYDDAIAVSPVDSSKIFVGGYNTYSFSPAIGFHLLKLFTDSEITNSYIAGQYLYVINDLNPDEVYIAAPQGVFKSSDANSNFASAQFIASNRGMAARDFISVAAARNGRVMGGSIDEESLLISNPGNTNFSSIPQAIGYCAFSQLDTNYAFIEEPYGELFVSHNYLASFVTAFDTSIDPQGQGIPGRCGWFQPSGDAAYITPCALYETKSAFATEDSVPFISGTSLAAGDVVTVNSKTANTAFSYTLLNNLPAGDTLMVPDPVQARLFLATSCGLWMKRHALKISSAPDWYQLSTVYPTCFAPTKDGNKIYFPYGDSIICLSGLNFGGYNTYKLVDSFPSPMTAMPGGNISAIAVDPNNDSILIAVTAISIYDSVNAYISRNAGNTWSGVQIGPAGLPIYACVIDANNNNNYIVGTEHGIWTSNDTGLSWQQDDAGMCDVPVYQLLQAPLLSDDCYVLYAATNSRGLWRSVSLTPAGCSTLSGITSPSDNFSKSSLRLFPNPATAYSIAAFNLPSAQQVIISIFDIAGRLLQTSVRFLDAGNQQIQLNTSTLSAGTYLVNIGTMQQQSTVLMIVSE
jgi:photosystem II stability/assembly factor-like uncharacterized protein